MELLYTGSVEVADMAAAFPVQRQVPFEQTDYATNLTPNSTQDFQSLKVEALLNCCFAQPLFVPHNQVNKSATTIVDDGTWQRATLPNVNWPTITLAGPASIQAFTERPWSFQFFDILATDETQATTMSVTAAVDPTYRWPGFRAFFHRNHFHFVDGSTTASTWEIQFTVNSYVYSLLGGANAYVQLRRGGGSGSYDVLGYDPDSQGGYQPSGTEWKILNGQLRAATHPLAYIGNSRPDSNSETISIEVLAFNGNLMIALGGGVSPYIVALPTTDPVNGMVDPTYAYPPITNVTVLANNFTQFSWHVHPTKFATTGEYVSLPLQFGYVPDASTPMYAHVTGLMDAYPVQAGDSVTENSATLTWEAIMAGAQGQYKLTLTNPQTGSYNGQDYADDTVAFARVSTHIDPLAISFPYVSRSIVPKEIKEVITFDPNRMTVHHYLEFTADNWLGIQNTLANTGLRGFGNMAVSMRMGWKHQGNSPVDGLPGFQHFNGYIDTWDFIRTRSNQALLRCSCSDQMQWLADQILAAPPNMDGWNHYYAIAWLAGRAGITLAQCAFAPFVPLNPFSVAPGDPNPQGYFLPFGNGMHPWTPRDRMLPILHLMEFIRRAAGYLLYIDAYGYLRYEPFLPPSQTPVKKIFRDTADFGYGLPGGAANEMRRVRLRNSTKDVRNQVVLVGIDSYSPDWNPIVVKLEDSNSIFSPPGVLPQGNFTGYPKPLIWLDSRFANVPFAEFAAEQIYNIVRLPDYTCDLGGWLVPELFPMDVIYVDDWRANSYGIPFYVLTIANTLSVMGDQVELSSQVLGKVLELD